MSITLAAKHLKTVEVTSNSNQHEFNGVASLKTIFGYHYQNIEAPFIYYGSDETVVQDVGELTWYNSRVDKPRPAEYRLYYKNNNAVNRARVGDLLVIGKIMDDSILVMIAQNGSSQYHAFMSLLGINGITNSYVVTYI